LAGIGHAAASAMWIPRQIEARLLELARTRPVLVLTGARQTGKTALCRHLFPEHHYVTLDLPSEAAAAEHDPASFLARLLSSAASCSASWRWAALRCRPASTTSSEVLCSQSRRGEIRTGQRAMAK
jgi:hypothetical protein